MLSNSPHGRQTAPGGSADPDPSVDLAAVPGLGVRVDEPLAAYSTFRIGGPAERLVEVDRDSALAALCAYAHTHGVPFQIVGLGSNVLFPDAGLSGLVVRLAGSFGRCRFSGDRVFAGGAVSLPKLALQAARRGLVGLEALSGFPSSVGGAVFMNAGCYGTEISDLLLRARTISAAGERRCLTVDDLEPAYRSTKLQGSGEIVTRAVLQLEAGDADRALTRIRELNEKRWASLPYGRPNAGSIFKNPAGDYAGRLIEAVGFKGLRCGGAEISAQHANVIVNLGDASADDVLELMVRARLEVASRFGVELEPELVLTGSLGERWRQAIR